MHKIFDWEAKRSSGTITVKGKTVHGHETTVVEIASIKMVDGRVVATRKDRTRFELMLAA